MLVLRKHCTRYALPVLSKVRNGTVTCAASCGKPNGKFQQVYANRGEAGSGSVASSVVPDQSMPCAPSTYLTRPSSSVTCGRRPRDLV